MFQKSQCGDHLSPCVALSVLASVPPLTLGCTTRRLGLTVPFCLVDCLLHEENFSVRCPKHKVSQSVCPQGAGGRGCSSPSTDPTLEAAPAPGPGRVGRPGAGGGPVPQAGPPCAVGGWEKRGGGSGTYLIVKRNSKIKLNKTADSHFSLVEPQFPGGAR